MAFEYYLVKKMYTFRAVKFRLEFSTFQLYLLGPISCTAKWTVSMFVSLNYTLRSVARKKTDYSITQNEYLGTTQIQVVIDKHLHVQYSTFESCFNERSHLLFFDIKMWALKQIECFS